MLEHRTPGRSRRTTLLVGAIVVAALAAALALALRLSGNEGVVLTGTSTYVEGVSGTWQRVNPLFASANEVDADLSELVFSGLVRIGPDGQVEPDLADLPQITDEGRTYTFTLRKGLTWHDGQPLTSRDVAFTVRTVTSSDFSGDQALAEGWRGADIDVPDDLTFVVRLRQPSAPFLARTATIGILPEHLLGSVAVTQLEDTPFNAAPVGSGPYKVESMDSREARLVANPAYHLGKPGVDRLVLKFYTDDASAIRALQSGDVRGLLLRETAAQGQLTDLRKVKDTRVDQLERSTQVLLYLNTTNALFRDQLVRQAISLGVDRRAIVDKEFAGAATVSSSPIAPRTWAYVAEYDFVNRDLEKARALLKKAGWEPSATTGILTRAGQEFRFVIRVDNDPVRVAIATDIATQLGDLGIRATVASTTFTVLNLDYLVPRRYAAAVAAWEQGPDPDPYFGWHSSQMGTAGLNLANFEDPVTDELIAKGRTSTDIEVRKDSYRQFQEIWQDLAPGIVIAYPHAIYAHPDGLKNLMQGVLFSGADRFEDVQEWRQ
ncbi:MAG: peptide ABC transporter substrate-binding protein [Dehalococcoidia bacterium]|nr:peptide ABC transporter substrate-binding protein [Dehalococcoidia bacterium]